MGYGEISAIFEIEADKNHVYKRLPLFDSRIAARDYQQMYLDYCSLLEQAGLCLPDHDTWIVAVPGRPAALYIAQKKLPDANFGHKHIHHLDNGSSLDLIEHAIREIVKILKFNSASKLAIELAIECVNAHLPRDQTPLTKTEVDKYYREDKLTWIVFLGLRHLYRSFTTWLLRERYEFILPGKIKR